ncbi:Zn(2)-C6 fungal-type domain-containing protein [Fusarium sp. LHS14.1]|nr:Zn(2)-C6 fungal-type domain-containing protein [Fusarium sp. LHS14.1]
MENLGTAPLAGSSRRAGYTRQRRGCLTCRQRKKKCDQIYPVCNHCSRLNLVCKREAPRPLNSSSPAPSDTAARTDSAMTRTPRIDEQLRAVTHLCQPLGLPLSESGDTEAEDLIGSRRAMLRYYTATFAFLLTTNLENNCFLSVILPMAFECPPLMYAVSAWASSHLALRDGKFKPLSLRHRGYALARLQESVQQSQLSTEMCLAVTMVLCSMESISEATDSWYPHLTGAAAALAQRPNSARDPKQAVQVTFEGRWLLRNFAYHDVMMSVSMDRPPLIKGYYWAAADESLPDPYFGFASRLLFLVSETSVLNADFADANVLSRAGQAISHGDRSTRARKIEDELQRWVCPSNERGSPLALLGEAYRNAALIHLYRTLRRHVSGYTVVLQAKIKACVEAIVKLSREVSEGCLVECTLLFPLFMAGGEAHEMSHIEAIREKLGDMIKWRKFRNVEACLEILDEVWRRRADGSRMSDQGHVDWVDIVKHKGWNLSIS